MCLHLVKTLGSLCVDKSDVLNSKFGGGVFVWPIITTASFEICTALLASDANNNQYLSTVHERSDGCMVEQYEMLSVSTGCHGV
eukprot:735697-Rhodomonas_salina.1